MGTKRIKPGPTDTKMHAIKYTPTHIVFLFDLVIWHLRYLFQCWDLFILVGKDCCDYNISIGKLNLRTESASQGVCRS